MKYILLVILAASQSKTSLGGEPDKRCKSVPQKALPPCESNRALHRYYFDWGQKRCQKYTIRNCNESGDPFFPTMGDCIANCRPNQTRRKCWNKLNNGHGRENLTRWYYNYTENHCYSFIYNGRGGNRNNFKYRDECMEECRYPTQYFVQRRTQILNQIKSYRSNREMKKRKAKNGTAGIEGLIKKTLNFAYTSGNRL
uniref:Putative salivary kunitz domain protein n=1 Tax=Ixodes ricinus TaxID=34613 RepID=A0A0K8R8D2_IXORI